MTPREAKTFDDICSLPRDNVSTDEHWIIINGENDVCISTQRNGEPRTESVHLPRETFEAFIDWYNTGKWKKPRKKKVKS